VRLRLGLANTNTNTNTNTTYGVHEHVAGNGHFTTTYTSGVGKASYRRYWFEIDAASGNFRSQWRTPGASTSKSAATASTGCSR
jgi:hypothetical protein